MGLEPLLVPVAEPLSQQLCSDDHSLELLAAATSRTRQFV
jgi:hypothetical protein